MLNYGADGYKEILEKLEKGEDNIAADGALLRMGIIASIFSDSKLYCYFINVLWRSTCLKALLKK